jgi:uncharacterized alkaline shock family protein YloU
MDVSTVLVNELGKIVYTDEVVAMIAGHSAMECYGVVGMTPTKSNNNIPTLLKKDQADKGIKVTSKNGNIDIDIYVVIEYGTSIAAVATNIIDTVKYAVHHLLGLQVNKIEVHVTNIGI